MYYDKLKQKKIHFIKKVKHWKKTNITDYFGYYYYHINDYNHCYFNNCCFYQKKDLSTEGKISLRKCLIFCFKSSE